MRTPFPAGALHRAHGNRALGIGAREYQVLQMRTLPIGAQDGEQLLGQHDIAVFATFALPHVDDHVRTVDITRGQRDRLRDTKTGRVDGDEDRSHLEIGHRLQKPHHLVSGKDGRQRVRLAGEGNVLSHTCPPKRGAVEEPYGAHDRNDRCGLQATRDEMQLILTDIFKAQLVRGLPEMQAEVLDGTDVGLLGVRRHVADRHIVNHALPQRRSLFWHGMLLSDGLH